tara:strand:- start:396 stop:1415 length:1020 start_codon:yes stop_codon:yes gene_type:complete
MLFAKIILSSFFIFLSSYSFSQNHNKIEVDLERVKKDIIDLQKFVYQNNSPNNAEPNSQDLEKIDNQIQLLIEKFDSFEKQIKDMKDDIANLYQLYTSPQFDKNKSISPSNELTIDESSSNLVTEKSNDIEPLEEFEITSSDIQNENLLEVKEDLPEQTLGKLSISSLEEQEIINLEPSEEGLATLTELEGLLEEREIELNKPKINVEVQLQLAKQNLASLENQKAIESLLLIIDSDSDNKEMLSEVYYLLGRTNFIENNMIDSVKYFGIRHRDFSEIYRFKAENYFWLGRSLFGIGDQENGCLIMEDIIFSDEYLNNSEVIEDSKALQAEQECGLIIN